MTDEEYKMELLKAVKHINATLMNLNERFDKLLKVFEE
jgi:hypothetical protein